MNTRFREQAQAQFQEDDHFEANRINDKVNWLITDPKNSLIGNKIPKSIVDLAIAETEVDLLPSIKPYLQPFGFETAKKATRWAQYRAAYEKDSAIENPEYIGVPAATEKFTFETAFREGDSYIVRLFEALDTERVKAEQEGKKIDDPLELERTLITRSLLNAMDDLMKVSGVEQFENHHEYVRVVSQRRGHGADFASAYVITKRFQNTKNNQYYLDIFQPGQPYGNGSLHLTIIESKNGLSTNAYLENDGEVELNSIYAHKAVEAIYMQSASITPQFTREPYEPKVS